MVYKWCIVPQCTNTSIKTPQKLFVSVPTNPKRRYKWLQLAKRDPNSILYHTNVFMCEDHFDIEKDTINYMKYKMGFSSKILLTDEAVPSKFHCQEDRKRRCGDPDHQSAVVVKRKRMKLLKQFKEGSYVQSQDITESVQKDYNIVQEAIEPDKDGNSQTQQSITPDVGQINEEVAEKEAPQTTVSQDSPIDVDECSYTSSTETASSGADEPPSFIIYKFKNEDKPRSTETTTAQDSNLNTAANLNLKKQAWSSTKKPVLGRKQKRPMQEETKTSAEIEKREELIEQYRCYKIIANVYHYLTREYQFMKKHIGDKCDLGSLANTLKRTADATGVSQLAVRTALETEKLKSSIGLEHNYDLGDKRITARKRKKGGSSSHLRKKGRTSNKKRRKNNGKDDGNDAEEVRPSKRRRVRKSITYKKQDDQIDAKVKPPKGRTTKNSIKSKPTNEEKLTQDDGGETEMITTQKQRETENNEEQVPFPKPIQLRAPQGTEIEYKKEPADDEREQRLEDDPLETVSRDPIHCRTPDGTETEFKTEVDDDDESLQKLKADPLDPESGLAEEEETYDPLGVQVKPEHEDLEEMNTDYAICEPALLDIKPEPPSV